MSWPLKPIGDYVQKIVKWDPRKSSEPDEFQYIDLSSVDKDKKCIVPELVSWTLPSEAPSRARQLVKSGDILVATVRPNLNGVAIVDDELSGATASTGYCILRPDPEKLDAKYLFYWVRTKAFIQSMMKQATGANYPAVSDLIIKNDLFPAPPLAEQKRIAAILDKADQLRQKRQQAIALADDFLRSVFLDMFGDPVTNPKGWEVAPLEKSINRIVGGWSANGENQPAREDQLGVLKISSVTSGKFLPSENKVIDASTVGTRKLVFPKKGNLLFSRANTRELVAATVIVEDDHDNIFLPDKLWNIYFDQTLMLPEFFHYLLMQPRMKDKLTSQATGTSGSMLNISKKKLLESEVILPPLEDQIRFIEIYWAEVKANKMLSESAACVQELFSSLSQKVFTGLL